MNVKRKFELTADDIKDAIVLYLATYDSFVDKKDIKLRATAEYSGPMDQPTGGYIITAEAEECYGK